MANNFMLFPSLSEEYLKQIRFQSKSTEFYYTNREGEEFELTGELIDQSTSTYKLRDNRGVWTQDDYNFGFRKKILLRTFQCLFGPAGVACRNARIGLAVTWTSLDSKQRGVFEVGQFGIDDIQLQEEADIQFQKAQLRGSVDFITVLYIADAGTPDDNEGHLANTPGFILGELERFTVKLDGSGSILPVFEVREEGQPLWYVKCDWNDPTSEALKETVSININMAHKNYKFLDRNQKTFDNQLLIEVMSSALLLIIERLRAEEAYWEDIMNGENLERGSVGEAIYYFKTTHNWDLSSPMSASLSMRKFFDQRM